MGAMPLRINSLQKRVDTVYDDGLANAAFALENQVNSWSDCGTARERRSVSVRLAFGHK
jgi:hypothetical protein